MITRRLLRWAERYVAKRPADIVIGKRAFLYRWYIIPRNPVFNIYLHQWWASDDDRALHDHPWWSLSKSLGPHLMTEEYVSPRLGLKTRRIIYDGKWVWRSPWFTHRMIVHSIPTYTLFITGPRVRIWGFWCPRGWRDFKTFSKKGCD